MDMKKVADYADAWKSEAANTGAGPAQASGLVGKFPKAIKSWAGKANPAMLLPSVQMPMPSKALEIWKKIKAKRKGAGTVMPMTTPPTTAPVNTDMGKKASADLVSRVLHKLASGDAFLVKIAACCKSGRCKKVEKKKLD